MEEPDINKVVLRVWGWGGVTGEREEYRVWKYNAKRKENERGGSWETREG